MYCDLRDHYDDERDQMFHNTTQKLYETKTKTDFFGLRPVLSYKTDGLRPHHWRHAVSSRVSAL